MVLLTLTRLGGKFIAQLAGVCGVFVRLLRQFVCSEMISFVMGRGSGKVSVGGKVMELSNSSVRALWHGLLLASSIFALPYWICNRPKTLLNFCRRC
jgi:hypothetical protein